MYRSGVTDRRGDQSARSGEHLIEAAGELHGPGEDEEALVMLAVDVLRWPGPSGRKRALHQAPAPVDRAAVRENPKVRAARSPGLASPGSIEGDGHVPSKARLV